MCLQYKSLKTLWEKEKLLVMSNFSFSHSVFFPIQKLSAIFIKFGIVVCKPFWFGSVQNLLKRVKNRLSDAISTIRVVSVMKYIFNHLPDDKILGLPKLKPVADDKLNVTQNISCVS